MNPNSEDLAASASSQVLSELFCPPIQVWVLDDETLFKITAATTIIICPVTILLNVLVILSVKKRKDLQNNNSNILLASMAVAGVLVGAVSMPLTIVSDVLVLVKVWNVGVFCGIAFVNDMVLYIGSCSSVYHLTVIAWERYSAIRKWADYKVIVTRVRVKKFARISWLLAALVPIPPSVMKIAGVDYKYLLAVDIACVLPGTVCMVLVGYLYLQVYLGVRKWEIEKVREVPIRAKWATKCAKTTAMLTVVLLIAFIPSLAFLLLGEIFHALRRSSFFRWSMMLAQLYSLFNPILYCCRDGRFRDAFLEMLKMKKPAGSAQRNNRQTHDVLPRSKTMANLPSNDAERADRQVRRKITVIVNVKIKK